MLVKIHPANPDSRQIDKVVGVLRNGGIIIYPTDTVYGFGCDIFNPKAVERIARIKGIDSNKTNFSFICSDLSHLSDYSRSVSTHIYKIMRKNLPGPFTFVLQASGKVPKIFQSKKKTVGIRIPNNNIAREIVKELGHPIMSTSVYDSDKVIEYTTDPELIHETYQDVVDLVIDGGFGDNVPSTVVDCTGDDVVILRQGRNLLDF